MYKFLTLIFFVAIFCCDKSIAQVAEWKHPGQLEHCAGGCSARAGLFASGWANLPIINPHAEKAQTHEFSERWQATITKPPQFVGDQSRLWRSQHPDIRPRVEDNRVITTPERNGWIVSPGPLK